MKRLVAPAAVVFAIACGWLLRPARWQVEGLSMSPGLMPGDVVESRAFALFDRRRRPERFECWTLAAPDGTPVVKRVWGLPGEQVEIIDGDLAVDGEVVVKPPAVLAGLALAVSPVARHETAGEVRLTLADPVFDDVPFAPDERRTLQAVRDVGVVAMVDVAAGDGTGGRGMAEVRVGGRTARIAIRRPGRHAVVAGRLDGAFVAAAWQPAMRGARRWCLPPDGPPAWTVQSPWTDSAPVTSLEVRLVDFGSCTAGVTLGDVVAWRDVHHVPPASGAARWPLGDDAWFVLGDFPGGSHDSRQWGPVGSDRFSACLALSAR